MLTRVSRVPFSFLVFLFASHGCLSAVEPKKPATQLEAVSRLLDQGQRLFPNYFIEISEEASVRLKVPQKFFAREPSLFGIADIGAEVDPDASDRIPYTEVEFEGQRIRIGNASINSIRETSWALLDLWFQIKQFEKEATSPKDEGFYRARADDVLARLKSKNLLSLPMDLGACARYLDWAAREQIRPRKGVGPRPRKR